MHHTNIATITKQRVFNKAMISKSTEVIFIDEASTSTLDIDDWKILTQGGYTACDVKYQTAKPFINRCPMLLTAQTKLQFKPEDQPAMDSSKLQLQKSPGSQEKRHGMAAKTSDGVHRVGCSASQGMHDFSFRGRAK